MIPPSVSVTCLGVIFSLEREKWWGFFMGWVLKGSRQKLVVCRFLGGSRQNMSPLRETVISRPNQSLLPLDVSGLQQPALPLDMSGLHQPVLPLDLVALLSVLPLDVSGLHQPVLPLCFWSTPACAASGLG
jgi:hypothetical protein